MTARDAGLCADPGDHDVVGPEEARQLGVRQGGRDLARVPGPVGQGARYGTGRVDDGGPDVVGLHLGKKGRVGEGAR